MFSIVLQQLLLPLILSENHRFSYDFRGNRSFCRILENILKKNENIDTKWVKEHLFKCLICLKHFSVSLSQKWKTSSSKFQLVSMPILWNICIDIDSKSYIFQFSLGIKKDKRNVYYFDYSSLKFTFFIKRDYCWRVAAETYLEHVQTSIKNLQLIEEKKYH